MQNSSNKLRSQAYIHIGMIIILLSRANMDRELIMADQQNDTIFREIQRWSLKFRCLLLVLCLSGATGGVFSAAAMITQDSLRLAAVLVTVVCGVFIPLGIGLLIWVNRLETEVRSYGLYIHYFPFHTRFKRLSTEYVEDTELNLPRR